NVWVLREETVRLAPLLSEHREVLLWDMAGQQGYRVVHQLHLDDVVVALLVMDDRNEKGSIGEVYYWERALRQARNVLGITARPQSRFLIAARVDRGGSGMSEERINAVLGELNLNKYFST